jgi:hypothetical protein
VSAPAVKVSRVRAGFYVAEHREAGSTYEVERSFSEYGGWELFEQVGGYRGEWCNWFPTKGDAVAAIYEIEDPRSHG